MTFVNCKGKQKSPQTFVQFYRRHLGRALGISVPGFGHSDIRGFGFLLTVRSMVRREPYRLKAWITVACANID